MFWSKKKEIVTPAPVDPSVQLQAAIDEQTGNLKQSHAAVEESAALARQLNRECDIISSDIQVLQSRLTKSPADPDLKAKLDHKNVQLEEKKTAMAQALATHDQGNSVLNEFHDAIESTKREADGLNVNLHLAEADKASAAFKAQLKGIGGSSQLADSIAALKQKTQAAKADATVDRSIVTDPNEARDNEYLKAAQQQNGQS